MVADATRGVKFVFSAAVDPDAAKAFEDMEKRVADLQKAMNLTLTLEERAANAARGAGAASAAARATRRASAGRIMGFAGTAAEFADVDQKQVAAAKARIEHLQRMADLAAQRDEDRTKASAARKEAIEKRAAAKDQAAKTKELASLIAIEERYHANLQQGKEREQRTAAREAETAMRKHELANARLELGLYDVAHAFGQVTRAAAQFGLVGQRDMMKVLDTIFAVEGGINAIQGAMGAVRAIRGIRGAMGAAGVAKGGAGIATAAGAGAPVAAAGAAGVGITAAIASAILTGREAMRYGIGGGAHVGGVVDRVASAEVGLMAKSAGLAHSMAGGIIDATAPFGLSSRQRELRTEGYLESIFGKGIGAKMDVWGINRLALENRRSERMERFTREDIEKRAGLDRGHSADFENRFGLARQRQERAEAIRERERMMLANFSPLTREGALLADSKRAVAGIGSQISELSAMKAAAVQNRMERMQPGQQAGGDFDASGQREIEAFELRIKELKTEQYRITRDMQQTAINGLKQQLELEKSRATTAQGRFQSALEARQSTEERLGRMTPGRVAAIARSKEKAERGDQLSLHDIENLEQGDERSQFLAKQAARQRFRGFSPAVSGTLGDEEKAKEEMKMRSAEAAAGHRDDLNRTIVGAEKAAGLARPEPIRVDVEFQKRLTLELKEMETIQHNRAVEFANEISPKIMEALNEDRERLVDEIMAKVRADMDQRAARQNQQGRATAGG